MTPAGDGVRGPADPGPQKEVDAELRYHLERTVEELVADGVSPSQARAEALRRFGRVKRYRERLVRIDQRRRTMERRSVWMATVWQGVAMAIRGLRRYPAFSAAVVLTLTLGIGANATMFSVVDRLLLSPPQHIDDADRVQRLYVQRRGIGGDIRTSAYFTYPDYRDFADGVSAFQETAAFSGTWGATLGSGTEAERIRTTWVSANFFGMLGVTPLKGRHFAPEEDLAGAAGTVVLSHEFWERRFGGDDGALGRVLEIDRGSYTVIGIAPPGFTGAELNPVDLWLPLETTQFIEKGDTGWKTADYARNYWWLQVVARLAPGVTPEAAEAEATGTHRAARADMTNYDPDARIIPASLVAARGPDPEAEAAVARWLAGVSLVVLLVACANVANLLLARAERWRRELAVRRALGISETHLAAQLLTEALVLSGLGAGAALALAHWGGQAMHQVLLPNVAFTDTRLLPRLLLFTGAAMLLTALLAGLVPAVRASRQDVADGLRAGGRGVAGGSTRLREGLLLLQGAFSLVLLVGAGLFVRSLYRAENLDMGFDPDPVAVVELEWQGEVEGAVRRDLYRQARERLQSLPFVRSAALSYTIPFWSSVGIGRPRPMGQDTLPRHPQGGPYVNKVSSGYFEAMGIEIVAGRGFTRADDAPGAPPVTVLSESLARAAWPRESAVGQCLLIGPASQDPPCTTVVGIAENHRRQELVEEDPHWQYYVNVGSEEAVRGPPQAMMVSVAGPPASRVHELRAALNSVPGPIRFAQVRPLSNFIDPSLRSWRLGAAMFTVFGLLALLVAAVGMYSVLAFDVAQRRQELGVRAALGASRGGLLGLVFRRSFALVLGGTAVGLLVALAAARWVEPLLFRVSPRDPQVLAGVVLTLVVVGLVSAAVPAWRATRADPLEALRAE